jgi:hypothetical protein
MTNHEETEADFGPLNTLKGTKSGEAGKGWVA